MAENWLPEVRPHLDGGLSGAELRRWYWLRDELAGLARELGVSAQGGKAELTQRLAARLDGTEPPRMVRRRSVDHLAGAELSGSTVLSRGQRCTQQLRSWFTGRINGFRFDGAMREFIAEGGHTLDDAVDRWVATRGDVRDIAPQFELNTFARNWHLAHPGGSHAAMLAAWRVHRCLPRETGRPGDG